MSRYAGFENVLINFEERVATISLNRPEALNAINVELHRELERLWGLISSDPDVDGVILTGSGRAFSAGGDVKRMAARIGTEEGLHHALTTPGATHRIILGLLEIQQPVISAINGDATGLGASLALLCDSAIIATEARIGDTHVLAGLVAGDGGAAIWPMLVGPLRAKEFLMTGRLLKGTEAVELGLANAHCPADKVVEEARALLRKMLRSPRWAVRWTKLAVNKWLKQQVNLTLDAGLGYEIATLFTDDHKEAVNAFTEKRKPKYTGW
ncbi:MAG: enoyl-CoA hydratase/isomerase family protein [Pseudomonadota bacterium]|nr:enoyl-CoA hydratase/isomerase family protein [Pseudomonadota bacterium]